jgi:hypothetical protein
MILFCFLFEGRIYEYTTPKVEVYEVTSAIQVNDKNYLIIPKSALIGDNSVYIVAAKQGIKRVVYTVKKQKVSYVKVINDSDFNDKNVVYIYSGLNNGDIIIPQLDGNIPLEDGTRIRIE